MVKLELKQECTTLKPYFFKFIVKLDQHVIIIRHHCFAKEMYECWLSVINKSANKHFSALWLCAELP